MSVNEYNCREAKRNAHAVLVSEMTNSEEKRVVRETFGDELVNVAS